MKTWEEEELLRIVRRIDTRLTYVEALVLLILRDQPEPTYTAPAGVAFAPTPIGTTH